MSFLLDNKKIKTLFFTKLFSATAEKKPNYVWLFSTNKIRWEELNNMTDVSSNITCNIEEMDLTKLSKSELLAKCEELGITPTKKKNETIF